MASNTARGIIILFLCLFYVSFLLTKPIKKETEAPKAENPKTKEEAEYLRYLGQVVEVLEEDEEFKKKLHNASEDEIRQGTIADHVDLLSHKVRTKLDELKRMEIEYQKRLKRQERDHLNGINERNFWSPMFDDNKDTFEVDDLRKLLHKHNIMMEEQDKTRKKDFHKYELEKEHKRREDLKKLDEAERKKKEQEHGEEIQKLRKHEKMHEPGSKAELEEVWKEEDGLDPESFDPKTFFKLHDKNGDGYLDTYELETFFLDDVDKVYNESDPNVDPKERQEELERMREHVMKQMDKDSDGLVSAEEFIKSTNEPEFEKDNEWKPVVDEDEYSEDELKDYERQLEEETKRNGESNDGEPEHHGEPGEHHENDPKEEHHEPTQEHHEQKEEHHEQPQQHHEQPKEQPQQHHEQPKEHHEQPQQHNEQPKQEQHEQKAAEHQQQPH